MAAPNSVTSFNYTAITNAQGLNLIATSQGQSVSAAGDTQMTPTGPYTAFVPVTVLTCNSGQGSTVDVHTATVGIYTQPAQGGTAVLTTAALTSQTTAAYAKATAATAVAARVPTTGNLYVNVGTTVAGGVIDVYLYGYTVS